MVFKLCVDCIVFYLATFIMGIDTGIELNLLCFQLELIAVGMPNMSKGRHPCQFCTAERTYVDGVAVWKKGRLRTLGMQREFARQFAKHLDDVKNNPKHHGKTQEEIFEIAKKSAMNCHSLPFVRRSR